MSTPLHHAVKAGKCDAVIMLIENGANINALNKSDRSPLHLAAKYGYCDIINLLLSYDVDVDTTNEYNDATPLHRAVAFNQYEAAELLLDRGANVNAAMSEEEAPTALMTAAWHNYDDLVYLLLKRGANVNASNNSNKTSLHLTSSLNIAISLVEHGIDILIREKWDNYTAIHTAIKADYKEIALVLLDECNLTRK